VLLFLKSLSDVVVRHQIEVGLMGYADESHDISPIQNYDDEDVYKLRVSSIRKMAKYPWFGWTNTGKAIAKMIELFDFNKPKKKLGVVITAGKARDHDDLMSIIHEVRRRKIEMAAVAVGFYTDDNEMAHIACSRKNLFHIVKGFDDLKASLLKLIMYHFCKAE
ncbi:von Willebrand factor type A domain protein, partial [Ancylostoma duodenale]